MTPIQAFKRGLAFILVLMLGYTATRLLFYFMNLNLYGDVSSLEALWSFVLGLRFDLASVLIANGIFLIWAVWTGWVMGPVTSWIFRIALTILNGAFLGLNVLDSEFYKFNGKRFSQEFLLNQDDLQRHSLSVFLTYWPLFSLFLLLSFAVFWLFPKFIQRSSKVSYSHWKFEWSKVLGVFALVVVIVVGIRGGFQLKPLNPINAYAQGRPELGALVLNSSYAFLRGRPTDLSEAPVYFENLNLARNQIAKFRGGTSESKKFEGLQNVIVLVVESLSLEYTGLLPGQTSYTPFVDRLSTRSLVFTKNFANGRRSIEAMPSIFCSLPSLTPQPIITSSLNQNELICLPHLLSQKGYETGFFHGAHNGSFHMDSFSKRSGFKNFYGFDEYGNEKDSDGSWGILDEPMLRFLANTVSEYKPPFFAGVFTLSSHHPYFIPEHLRGKFRKGPLEIHESIGYADYSLETFFELAKTKPWYKDTLFIITGDHTQKSHDPKYSQPTANYMVPMIVFSENESFRKWTLSRKDRLESQETHHADIYPTVLDALGLDSQLTSIPFGRSALNGNQKGLAVNFDGFQYWLRSDTKFVTLNPKDGVTSFFRMNGFVPEKLESDGEFLDAEQTLKALVSFFNLGMRTNTIYQKTDRVSEN